MSKPLVPAAARAVALFELFAREKRELSNTEIARALDLAESSCSDLITTFVSIGYLARSARSRRLYPTGRLYSVASEIHKNDARSAALRDACMELAQRTGESALCGSLEGGLVTVLAFAAGERHALRYESTVGARLSLHASAIGKAILARRSDAEAAAELASRPFRMLASETLTDPEALLRQIAGFREQGWALVENEGSEGLASLAIAGRMNGEDLGLCVAGALPRMRQRHEEYLLAIREVGQTVFEPAAAQAPGETDKKRSSAI